MSTNIAGNCTYPSCTRPLISEASIGGSSATQALEAHILSLPSSSPELDTRGACSRTLVDLIEKMQQGKVTENQLAAGKKTTEVLCKAFSVQELNVLEKQEESSAVYKKWIQLNAYISATMEIDELIEFEKGNVLIDRLERRLLGWADAQNDTAMLRNLLENRVQVPVEMWDDFSRKYQLELQPQTIEQRTAKQAASLMKGHSSEGKVPQPLPQPRGEFSAPPAKVSRSSVHITAVPSGTYDTIENVQVTGVQAKDWSQVPQETYVSLVGQGSCVKTVRNAKVVGVQMSVMGGMAPSSVGSSSAPGIPEKVSQKVDLKYGITDEEILKVLAERTRLYAHPVDQFTIDEVIPVLGYVAGRGKVETLRALLQAGADVNEPDLAQGWTPLMRAARNKNHECLAELLQRGARTDLTDNDGSKTAFDIAREKNDPEAMRMLRVGKPSVSSKEKAKVSRFPSEDPFFKDRWIPGKDSVDDESVDEQMPSGTVHGEIGVRLTGEDLRRIAEDLSSGLYVREVRVYNDAGKAGRTIVENVRTMGIDWGVYPSSTGKKGRQ